MKTHIDGSSPKNGEIFVFGSNQAGIHGAGAAKAALLHFAAVMGIGHGLRGQSYAIPTKDCSIVTLELKYIEYFVQVFNDFVRANPDKEFWLTRIGCVLAGYSDEEIAPLFEKFDNVSYPEQWVDLIG